LTHQSDSCNFLHESLFLCTTDLHTTATCSASASGHKIHASRSWVTWLLRTLHSMLPCLIGWAYFLLLPIADEGQGKETSFWQGSLILQIKFVSSTAHNVPLTKPEKVLLHNTNLAYTIAQENWHTGTIRETFFVNQISQHHDILAPDRGDFLADETWTIEVGGQNKDHCQIAGIDNAYIAADDIETGQDQRVPLWLFGFLA